MSVKLSEVTTLDEAEAWLRRVIATKNSLNLVQFINDAHELAEVMEELVGDVPRRKKS